MSATRVLFATGNWHYVTDADPDLSGFQTLVHVITAHEDFDSHMCKVADRWGRIRRGERAAYNLCFLVDWARSGFGEEKKRKKEKHCLCPKIMVNNYPMFPIVSAADPWRLRSDWCLIVLCCCSSSPFSVARKCRGTGQLFLIYLLGQMLAYWAVLHSLVGVCVLIIDTLHTVGSLQALPRRPVCSWGP